MMTKLIGAVPSAIRHMTDSTLFYFGSQTADINQLPGKAQFEVVYSPSGSTGWEVVRYQWFEEKNGMMVLDRRSLEPDEIQHFERMLATARKRGGTQPFTSSAVV
jgi:hypothetical protein